MPREDSVTPGLSQTANLPSSLESVSAKPRVRFYDEYPTPTSSTFYTLMSPRSGFRACLSCQQRPKLRKTDPSGGAM